MARLRSFNFSQIISFFSINFGAVNSFKIYLKLELITVTEEMVTFHPG